MVNVSEIDEMRILKNVQKMTMCINTHYLNHSEVYKGFYALLSAKYYLNKYFSECENEKELIKMRICMHNVINELLKDVYQIKKEK